MKFETSLKYKIKEDQVEGGAQLVWPSFGADAVMGIFLFLLSGLILYKFTDWIFHSQKTKDKDWQILHKFASKKSCSQKELKILREFFYRLSESQRKDLLQNWNDGDNLRIKLYSYLASFSTNDPKSALTLYSRLFRKVVETEDGEIAKVKFEGVSDLTPREMIAVDFQGERLLGVVGKINEDQFSIQIKGFTPTKEMMDESVVATVYRPGLGIMAIKGKITKPIKSGFVMKADEGGVENRGEEHLMLELRIIGKLVAWPKAPKPKEAITDPFATLTESTENPNVPALKPSVKPTGEEINIDEVGDILSSLDTELVSLEDILAGKSNKKNVQAQILQAREERVKYLKEGKGENASSTPQKKSEEKAGARYSSQTSNLLSVSEVSIVIEKISDRGAKFSIHDSSPLGFWKGSDLWELQFHFPGGLQIEARGRVVPLSKSNQFLFKAIDMPKEKREALLHEIKALGGVPENFTN